MTGDKEINKEEWTKDELSRKVIEGVIQVHQELGPGFLEGIYQNSLRIELRRQSLAVETEKDIPIRYQGIPVGRHRLDLLVEGRLLVEVKAVRAISQVHYAQTRSYLKAAGLDVALLVNFSTPMADFRRICFP